MAYVVRLEGYDQDWRPTREQSVRYTDLPRGSYVFQVRAVDRDLNYSEPAEVRVTIHLPYGRMTAFGVLGMAIVVAVVTSSYAVKRRRERNHAQQALLEATQRHEAELEERVEERTAQLRSLSSELSLTEQRERRRIAVDLHDHIGQTLAISRIRLDAVQESASSEDASKRLEEIGTFIDQAIGYTRSLTFQLSPPVLYEVGFEAALEWLAEHIQEQYGLSCTFEEDGESRQLDENVRVLLFQAVRELLINVVKHARAHHARISVRREDDHIRITVQDDGVGFDPSELRSHAGSGGGFGLFNIRERLDYLGGELRIDSEPGRATRMILIAPLKTDFSWRTEGFSGRK
jgi:signal transduction histidine kinase